MLVDLKVNTIVPTPVFFMLAGVNGIDINMEDNSYFEHYETGIYRHDGYLFNFEYFINERCNNTIADKVYFGVCDNYQQVLDRYSKFLNNPNKKYVIGLSTVERKSQPNFGGWKWSGWGSYIGDQNPQHDYLYDDKHIDKVYVYQIFEIEFY